MLYIHKLSIKSVYVECLHDVYKLSIKVCDGIFGMLQALKLRAAVNQSEYIGMLQALMLCTSCKSRYSCSNSCQSKVLVVLVSCLRFCVIQN